jgi:hypothetical protein
MLTFFFPVHGLFTIIAANKACKKIQFRLYLRGSRITFMQTLSFIKGFLTYDRFMGIFFYKPFTFRDCDTIMYFIAFYPLSAWTICPGTLDFSKF